MSERRCFGCMRTTSQHYCEHCGWPADRQNESHQLPVGTVLMGKYQIGRVLGQGGFGITYLGWDMNLDIQVCIKEFYPSSTVNRDVTRSTVVNCNTTNMEGYYAACLERFLREGKALAKFRNVPQIVGIHDFFQLNNTAYMVMEFVSGIDLAKYVQKRGGRLHMDEILKILRPVMEALQLVHDAGIIHRDISPDNIMLEPREGAKLLDFGAVRNVEHPDAEKELTRATEAILKNGFAPMEQYVAKGSLGPWTDVYAMSATIYYCLTGRIPEDSPIRLMEGTELDWTGAQGLTERQKAVLEKGMEPRAKDRIASIRELMEKLYAVEAAPAPVPTPQREKDPLKTEIISEFKVVMPPEPQKQPEKQPEPAPAPVVAEPQKQPEERVILPASRKVEEPAQLQQPEKKPKPTWIIAVAAVLVLAILAGVFLIPKKETDTPQVSHQQTTTNPTEQTMELATTLPTETIDSEERMIWGLEMTLEEFERSSTQLLETAGTWTMETAPQTLDDFPLFPPSVFALFETVKSAEEEMTINGATMIWDSELPRILPETITGMEYRPTFSYVDNSQNSWVHMPLEVTKNCEYTVQLPENVWGPNNSSFTLEFHGYSYLDGWNEILQVIYPISNKQTDGASFIGLIMSNDQYSIEWYYYAQESRIEIDIYSYTNGRVWLVRYDAISGDLVDMTK